MLDSDGQELARGEDESASDNEDEDEDHPSHEEHRPPRPAHVQARHTGSYAEGSRSPVAHWDARSDEPARERSARPGPGEVIDFDSEAEREAEEDEEEEEEDEEESGEDDEDNGAEDDRGHGIQQGERGYTPRQVDDAERRRDAGDNDELDGTVDEPDNPTRHHMDAVPEPNATVVDSRPDLSLAPQYGDAIDASDSAHNDWTMDPLLADPAAAQTPLSGTSWHLQDGMALPASLSGNLPASLPFGEPMAPGETFGTETAAFGQGPFASLQDFAQAVLDSPYLPEGPVEPGAPIHLGAVDEAAQPVSGAFLFEKERIDVVPAEGGAFPLEQTEKVAEGAGLAVGALPN